MMLHHYTKFGYRRFSSWGDTVQINIHWNSEPLLWHWPGPQQSNPICSQDNPPYDNAPSNQASCKRISSSGNIKKRSYFDYIILNCDLDFEDSKSFFLKDNLAHNDASPYPSSKRLSNSENIIWINIHWHSEILLWPWPWTQQSNFSIKHSGLWQCTIKPSLVAKGSAVQKIQ